MRSIISSMTEGSSSHKKISQSSNRFLQLYYNSNVRVGMEHLWDYSIGEELTMRAIGRAFHYVCR